MNEPKFKNVLQLLNDIMEKSGIRNYCSKYCKGGCCISVKNTCGRNCNRIDCASYLCAELREVLQEGGYKELVDSLNTLEVAYNNGYNNKIRKSPHTMFRISQQEALKYLIEFNKDELSKINNLHSLMFNLRLLGGRILDGTKRIKIKVAR